jgi:hypothetical protein
MLGHYQKADTILRAIESKKTEVVFLRIENYLLWGQNSKALQLLHQLLRSVPGNFLINSLEVAPQGAAQIPYDNLLIRKKMFEILSDDLLI